MSRTASPAVPSSLESSPSLNGTQKEQGTKPRGKFVEPPVLPPQPSYIHDRVNPNNNYVLSGMQPLGTFPPKGKGKAKADMTRPSSLSKVVESATAATPAITPPVEAPHPEPPPSEPSRTKRAIDEVDQGVHESTPQKKTRRSSRVAQTSSAQDSSVGVSLDGQSEESRRLLGAIVNRCGEIAVRNGHPSVATAVHGIYHQSATDLALSRILRNILTQQPLPSDTATFQELIKQAKKESMIEEKKQNENSKSKGKEKEPVDALNEPQPMDIDDAPENQPMDIDHPVATSADASNDHQPMDVDDAAATSVGASTKKQSTDIDEAATAPPDLGIASAGITPLSLQGNMTHGSDSVNEVTPTSLTAAGPSAVDNSSLHGDATKMDGGSPPIVQAGERSGSSPLSSTHTDDIEMAEASSSINAAVISADGIDAAALAPPKKTELRRHTTASKKKTSKKSKPKNANKSHKRIPDYANGISLSEEEREAKKRKLTKHFPDHFPESYIRHSASADGGHATDQSSGDSSRPIVHEDATHSTTGKSNHALDTGPPLSNGGSGQATPGPTQPTRKEKAAKVKMS